MSKIYQIKEIIENDESINIMIPDFDTSLIATGELLIDSDNLALMYKLDDLDSFSFIKIEKYYWEDLLPIYFKEKTKVLVNDTYELINFSDELIHMSSNIEDNPNYGIHFVDEFCDIFVQ